MNSGRTWIVGVAIAAFGVVAIGCAGAGTAGGTPEGTMTAAAAPTLAPSPSFAGQVIDIVAKDREFSLTKIEVAAGSDFEIRLDNQDEHLYAIYITDGEPDSRELKPDVALISPFLFKGEYVQGPATVTYDVPALTPGSYVFWCPAHPSLLGTLEVK